MWSGMSSNVETCCYMIVCGSPWNVLQCSVAVARNALEMQECSFVLSEMEFNIRVEGRSRFRTFENYVSESLT